jgi:hypothetical protein
MNRVHHRPTGLRLRTMLTMLAAAASSSLWAAPQQPPEAALKHASLDEKFTAIAKEVPGFGGMFFDDNGDLAIYLTQPESRAAAQRQLTQVFGTERLVSKAPTQEGRGVDKRKLPAGEIRVLKGQYGFDELEQWRKSAAEVLNVDGVVFTDVDESKNRIAIGVTSPKARERAEAVLSSYGVPFGAFVFKDVAAPKPLATLSDYFGPVFGGLAISNSGQNCSFGFNAYWGPYQGFVTASHCSSSWGSTDYSYFNLRGTYAIGYEIRDPALWTSIWPWDCPWGRRCRHSDASFVYNPGWIGWNYARIARTTSWNGSTTIDPAAPTFTITTEQFNPVMNQELDKVGAQTGWTFGLLSGTCMDVNVPGTNITLKCQNRVSATAAAGDSGAPVFEWHPDGNVYLVGIVALGNGGDYWYSPILNIRNDLYQPGYGLRTYF